MAYLLLCFGLAFLALRFWQSYVKVRDRGVHAPLGLYLFSLFLFLAFGTGLLAALYQSQIRDSFIFRAEIGVALVFFGGAAVTGILLTKYMLPRLGRLMGLVALLFTLIDFGWFGAAVLSNPFSLLAAVEKIIFTFSAISIVSLMAVVSQFFLLVRNQDVKRKSVILLAFLGTIFCGIFEGLVATPIFKIPQIFSSIFIGLLGVSLIIVTTLPAIHSILQFQRKNETPQSVIEFINAF